MRLLHFVRMVVLVLAVVFIGCGGGGGGGEDAGPDPVDTPTFNPNLTVDGNGDSLTLGDGAVMEVPAGVVAESTAVEFKKTEKPDHLGEEAIVYRYSSDKEIQRASFSLPVSFAGIESKDDLGLIYARDGDGAYNVIDFQWNAEERTISFEIDKNWTFENMPETIKGSIQTNLGVLSSGSSFISSIISIKKGLIDVESFPNSKDPMPMPFYTQMGETCWATTGKMMEKSLYAMGQDPGNQIYDFMEILDVTYEEGLLPNKYPGYAKLVSWYSDKERTQRYYLVSSVKYKILELLNRNRPVLFARNGHQVLIVGYKTTSEGTVLIQHNPAFYVPGKGPYEEMEFYDSFYTAANGNMDPADKDAIPLTEASILTWVETGTNPARTLQTVSIPDNRSQYGIYFTGRRTETENSLTIGLQFDNNEEDGYAWVKDLGAGTYDGGAFPINVNNFKIELPVWNTNLENYATLSLAVTIYEEKNPKNRVAQEFKFSLPPETYAQKDSDIDITPLYASLKKESDFVLNIALKNETNVLEDISVGKIVLQPLNSGTTPNGLPDASLCPVSLTAEIEKIDGGKIVKETVTFPYDEFSMREQLENASCEYGTSVFPDISLIVFYGSDQGRCDGSSAGIFYDPYSNSAKSTARTIKGSWGKSASYGYMKLINEEAVLTKLVSDAVVKGVGSPCPTQ